MRHLNFVYYNFICKNMTLKTTPAVATVPANKPLTMLELVKMIEDEESQVGGRLTDYLPSPKNLSEPSPSPDSLASWLRVRYD